MCWGICLPESPGFPHISRTAPCRWDLPLLTHIDYKDTQMLRKYVTDRGKIKPRRVTGACTQHQRDIAEAVKRARVMALMPYAVPAVSGRGDRRNR